MSEPKEAEDAVAVPAEFFEEVLPRSRDLAELKVTLHVIGEAARAALGRVALQDLLSAPILRSVAGSSSPEPAEDRLLRGLDRALVSGSLLRLTVNAGNGPEVFLLPATRRNRDLIERLRGDDSEAAAKLGLGESAQATVFRPNLFAFYEQHIGTLTPLVAEQLRDAERSYPRAWIEAAIRTAVHYNKRNWRYVEAVLTRWEATGVPDGIPGQRA
jgi:DNA replication protein